RIVRTKGILSMELIDPVPSIDSKQGHARPANGENGMLLAIDVGNTNVVIGIFGGSELLASWRLESDRDKTPDEWWALLHTLAAADAIDLREAGSAILASVVPRLTGAFGEMIQHRFDLEPVIVSADTDLGITIHTEFPAEVGPDRLVNAVAAHALYPGPAVVVDFGTATTFDVVTAEGEYIGGAIAPGVTVALEALTGRAARLIAVDLTVPDQAIGRNTTQSIQSGTMLGYLGLIEGLISRISRELGTNPTVIATGGLGGIFTGQTPAIHAYEPDLTLIGLRLIHEHLRRS
ncbi:MAG TPA: type III pantothenate kinase, partial [Nitrolancea sp.]|nr:type III pantothenate kinase [Nitrolancea sp.]